jgi:flagellar motor switch protein FliN
MEGIPMADDNLMSQDEIERLLNQQPKAAAPAASKPAPAAAPPGGPLQQNEIEALLHSSAKNAGAAPASSHSPQSTGFSDDDSSKLLAQEEIEKLLGQTRKAPAATKEAPRPQEVSVSASASMSGDDSGIPQGDIEFLLHQAQQALASIDTGGDGPIPNGVIQFRLPEFAGAPPTAENTTIDLIRDVELDLKIELGRTHMYLEDVLRLRKGSVVPLDKLAGDPVDIFVNGRLIARGEVLVLNDNFCVRVAELIAGAQPA